jgi:hypothetical protein
MEYVLLDLLALGVLVRLAPWRRIRRVARGAWALWHVPPVRAFVLRPAVPDPAPGDLVDDADRLDFAAAEASEPA